MTIAIGLMLRNGIVIAADTEESGGYAGNIKTSGHKVLVRASAGGAMAVSGSGDAGYLDAVSQEIEKEFLNQPMDDLQTRLKTRFSDFYEEHIMRLYQYERFNRLGYEPDIYVIFGADLKSDRFLLANHRTALRECSSYVAVGAGAEHANMLLARMYEEDMYVDIGAIMAAYIVFSVKKHVAGCGMKTEVFTLSNGNCSEFHQHQYRGMEQLFEDYLNIEPSLLFHIFGTKSEPERGFPSSIRKQIAKIRSQMLDLISGKRTRSENGRLSARISTRPGRGRNERGKKT